MAEKKIDKLTKKQEMLLVEHRDKWLAIGRSTEPADRPKAEAAITGLYKDRKLAAPEFWWVQSPASGSMVRAFVAWLSKRDEGKEKNADALVQEILASGLPQLLGKTGDSALSEPAVKLIVLFRADLPSMDMHPHVQWPFWGQQESDWIAYYLFPHEHIRPMYKKEDLDRLYLWRDIAQSCGWWWPNTNVCMVCDRPCQLHIDEAGRLHKDEAPAMEFRDGYALYALHGTRMKPEYVMTRAEQIAPETVLAEPNVDQRRELIRKIGVERMLSKLPHKVLEQRRVGEELMYELLSVRLADTVPDARYLKMLNPSIGVWHIEAVPPGTATISAALKDGRNGGWFETAEVLT